LPREDKVRRMTKKTMEKMRKEMEKEMEKGTRLRALEKITRVTRAL